MDEAYEETGWKLVHGDIFRPPQHRAFFVANLGAGIQLIAMSVSFSQVSANLGRIPRTVKIFIINKPKLTF